ncbi:hypothetical protein HPB50_020046 [Hyalomma asiaticum]|uniref:Uncharacterized protein n=1 Tax=Hyalomma asiaticum TaxID=266040 RepID=A0ACB7SGV9_HYAAI|nr:hypothetical protein HPB50_020046 [Hyalomma asiaticum]
MERSTTMIVVLYLFTALIGSALASFGHGFPSPGFSVHGGPFGAWSKTIHNVPTHFGLQFTGISYRHRWEAPPNVWGLSPYGLNYGYGLNAFGYQDPWNTFTFTLAQEPRTVCVLCLFAALVSNAFAVYVPTYGLPVAGYPTVPAVTAVHAAPVAAVQTVHRAVPVAPTVHNVATPYGYRTTGVSYSHRVDAHPVKLRYVYGLTPYGLNYGYGLDAYGYPTVLKKW